MQVSKQHSGNAFFTHLLQFPPKKKEKVKNEEEERPTTVHIICLHCSPVTVTFHSKFFMHVCLEFMCAPDYLREFF